jgi:hypothetical protein
MRTLVTPVTDLEVQLAHDLKNWESTMPKSLVMFDVIEDGPGMYHCYFCGQNPATLKCAGAHDGPCCLQCAFSILANLAERTVDNVKRAG